MARFTSVTVAVRTGMAALRQEPARMVSMVLRRQEEGLELLQRRAREAARSMEPGQFYTFMCSQIDDSVARFKAAAEELKNTLVQTQPQRKDFESDENYKMAVGTWMVVSEEAAKTVRRLSDSFGEMVQEMKKWLVNIMAAMKISSQEGFYQLEEFTQWMSTVKAGHNMPHKSPVHPRFIF